MISLPLETNASCGSLARKPEDRLFSVMPRDKRSVFKSVNISNVLQINNLQLNRRITHWLFPRIAINHNTLSRFFLVLR